MRLYVECHCKQKGYAIARTWSDAECSALPAAKQEEIETVRFVPNAKKAFTLVERWNRRFSTH